MWRRLFYDPDTDEVGPVLAAIFIVVYLAAALLLIMAAGLGLTLYDF